MIIERDLSDDLVTPPAKIPTKDYDYMEDKESNPLEDWIVKYLTAPATSVSVSAGKADVITPIVFGIVGIGIAFFVVRESIKK